MREDILHSYVCFHGIERKYLHGRGSSCPAHRMHKPGGVLNASRCHPMHRMHGL